MNQLYTDCEHREYFPSANNNELSIKIQPIDVTTKIGTYVNLSAVVKSPNPSFQWYNQFGQQIPNKNESNLFIGPVRETDFGFYKLEIIDLTTNQRALTQWVEVKNSNTIYFDRSSEQTTGNPPELLNHTKSGTYHSGITVELTGHFENATAYQWFKDGHELSGCNGNNLMIVDSKEYNTGTYTLKASNNYGSETTQQIQVFIQ